MSHPTPPDGPGRPRPTPGVAGPVPLRPLTVPELLDGAIALLRAQGGRLFAFGAVAAVVEQVLLFPLRMLADQDRTMLPAGGRLVEFSWLLIVSFTVEAVIITLLAGVAAARAGDALLGRFAPPAPQRRGGSLTVVVLVVAAVTALTLTPWLLLEPLQSAGFATVPLLVAMVWPLPYGLLGLAAPASVLENRGPFSALRRSLRVAGRNFLRATFVRLLGYASWALIRAAVVLATLGLVSWLWGSLPSATWDRVLLAVAALLINVVMYPALGCLDVLLLLEARMRGEGLDIALRWALRRGVAPTLDAPKLGEQTVGAPR